MAGFSLSPDELTAVCARIRAQADALHDRMLQASGRQSGAEDFGGARHAELAQLYREVLDGVIPRIIGDFRTATSAMSTGFEQTLGRYIAVDEETAARMNLLP